MAPKALKQHGLRQSCANLANAHGAAERAARESYGRLVAYLAAPRRDVSAAEDALADAFAAALRVWPVEGVPANPEGWLVIAARRRLIDLARRRRNSVVSSDAVALIEEELRSAEAEPSIPDRRLALMFACAHPAIDPAIRAPLMLQTILGLDAAAIGSAFLVSPTTMGQRLSRAKAKIRLAGIPFKIPEREELAERLDAVLDAIYVAFSRGWDEAFSEDPRGRDLADEAIWLGRVVVAIAPNEPEAKGLLSLMLAAHSRRAARRDALQHYVPLSEQDTSRWDGPAIDEAEALLRDASEARLPGRFQIEAAIQSAHLARRFTARTDWAAIATLYDALYAMTASPVVGVNRAAARAHADGPTTGLALLGALGAEERLESFAPYWVVKGDLCEKTGERDEARRAYTLAIGLQTNSAARAFLARRLAALA